MFISTKIARARRLAWIGRWTSNPDLAGSNPAEPVSNFNIKHIGIKFIIYKIK